MRSADKPRSELYNAVARHRAGLIAVGALTALLNILLLGGSIYMMLVYDSVLPSHSLPTLFFLFAGVGLVYLFQVVFETMRSGILTDIGCAVDEELNPRVQQVMSERALIGASIDGDGLTPMRDLDQIRGFLSSPAPTAFFDLPWVVFFLAVLTMLHVWLGVTALIGAGVLVGLAYVTHRTTSDPARRVAGVTATRFAAAERVVHHAETLAALGMMGRMRGRFQTIHDSYLDAQDRPARLGGLLGGTSKTFRMFLQSGVLTVGALLVISGEASPGVIFASSILSGRALAPIDSAISNWRGFAAACSAWRRLSNLLGRHPAEATPALSLPYPRNELSATDLHVAPPGSERLVLKGVDFSLKAGEVVGIVGPSAAGKSSLARALLGLWHPARGAVRYDGATPDQWSADRLGSVLGYLPQTVELFDGTIAANIARFDINATSEAVVAAARMAGVHDLIVGLPDGYNTQVGFNGAALSAGQRQRIGLARALYGDPFLVVLDEPNSNLDGAGEEALARAIRVIRERGGIAAVVTHRPAILSEATHILLLQNGRMAAFGKRDDVMRRLAPQQPASSHPTPAAPAAAAPVDAERGQSSTNERPNVAPDPLRTLSFPMARRQGRDTGVGETRFS